LYILTLARWQLWHFIELPVKGKKRRQKSFVGIRDAKSPFATMSQDDEKRGEESRGGGRIESVLNASVAEYRRLV